MISFAEYYRSCYGVTVTLRNQNMIRAIAKVDKKINKGNKLTKSSQAIYLIP